MTSTSKHFNPAQIITLGFLVIILIGTLLLNLPVASAAGESIGFLNALFTATSAVCVTGLVVLDTGSDFSLFGQIVIMFLIQIGGLGFMTFGVTVALILGKKIGLKQRLLIQQATNSISAEGLVRLVIVIAVVSFLLEAIGTIVLAIDWYPLMGSKAIYYALFHSISAFNNAGFALWSDSLSRFVGDPVVNITITTLFIVGGLGFTVILDIYHKRNWSKLSLNSKIVITTTLVLAVTGFLFIFLIELFNSKTLGALSWNERLWAAYFQGVVPRTAGFNTVDIAGMTTTTQLFIIFLMFIGASSGSTGGGIKVNTFFILIASVISTIKGQPEVNVYQRRIGWEMLKRALAVVVVSLGIVFMSTLLLTLTEHSLKKDFIEVLFEAFSAFGTVGLSMGLTSELCSLGKLIIIVTMFIGRLGPLTLAFALNERMSKSHITYVEEKVLIG